VRGSQNSTGAQWLWIADLSKPEQLTVRILPLLMVASQLLVAKITLARRRRPAHGSPYDVDAAGFRIRTLSAAKRVDVVLAHP